MINFTIILLYLFYICIVFFSWNVIKLWHSAFVIRKSYFFMLVSWACNIVIHFLHKLYHFSTKIRLLVFICHTQSFLVSFIVYLNCYNYNSSPRNSVYKSCNNRIYSARHVSVFFASMTNDLPMIFSSGVLVTTAIELWCEWQFQE